MYHAPTSSRARKKDTGSYQTVSNSSTYFSLSYPLRPFRPLWSQLTPRATSETSCGYHSRLPSLAFGGGDTPTAREKPVTNIVPSLDTAIEDGVRLICRTPLRLSFTYAQSIVITCISCTSASCVIGVAVIAWTYITR